MQTIVCLILLIILRVIKRILLYLKIFLSVRKNLAEGYKWIFTAKTIYVVSSEDLLISKLIWIQDFQSPLQMEDIKNLAEIDSLDKVYISKWGKHFETEYF